MPIVKVLNPPPRLGGAKTTALFVTARFETTEEPVAVQVEPFVRLSVDVEVESVAIAPVKADADAFSVTKLPPVAFKSVFDPALAVVLLKLIVAVEGSAKMRSPVWLAMVKLLNVAVWFVPPRNAIAPPAEAMVPPPVATMEAPAPCRPIAVAPGLVVVTLRGPDIVIEPAPPLPAASLASNPKAPAPVVLTVVAARLTVDPAPSALTP